MNAPVSIDPESLEVRTSIADANEWRGAMAHLYARGELCIAKRLRRELPGKTLPRITSQRIAKLRAIFEGKPRLLEALDDFEAEMAKRNFVVHGCGLVVEKGRGWLLALEYDDGKELRRTYVHDGETKELRDELSRVVSRLVSRLGQKA